MSDRKLSILDTYEQSFAPRERGKAETCEICSGKFSFRKRQHQCKRCFRAVCDSCANHKVDVYKINFQKGSHRLCKICKGESDLIHEYIQGQGLKFKTNSEVGKKWKQKIGSWPADEETKSKYFIDFTEDLMMEFWNSLNYSVREFVGIVTEGLSLKQIYKPIFDVLTAIGRRTEVKIQTSPYVVLLLLCFCSMDTATEIGVFLFSGLKRFTYSKLIMTETLKLLGCNEMENQRIEEYMDVKLRKFMASFSINITPFFVSECILQEMILGLNVQLIGKFFCAFVYSGREQIVSKIKNKDQLDFWFIRNSDLTEIKRNFNQLKVERSLDSSRLAEGQADRSFSNMMLNTSCQQIFQDDDNPNHSYLSLQLNESINKTAMVQIQNRRLKQKILSYQKQMKESEYKLRQYKQEMNTSSITRSSVDYDKQRLHQKIDKLEKEKDELQKEVERLRDMKGGGRVSRVSYEEQDLSSTRIESSFSISDSNDIQELKRELTLLTSTLKDKNSKILILSKQNKKLSFQKIRKSQQFDALTQQQKSQTSRIQTLEKDKSRLEHQNKKLMKKLETICCEMLDLQENLIETYQEKFDEIQERNSQLKE